MAKTKNKKEPMRTIKITEAQYYDLINQINKLDRILDSIREINDIYLSDLNTLGDIKWDLTKVLNLKWNSDIYRYEEDKGEEV